MSRIRRRGALVFALLHSQGLWRRRRSLTREVAPAATQDARAISHGPRLAAAVTTSRTG